MKQPILRKDIQSLMRHLTLSEQHMCKAVVDEAGIADIDDRNAFLALAISEYELLVKPAAYDPDCGTGEVRDSVRELAKLYAMISSDSEQKAWDDNAVRIIYYSQTHLMQQKRDGAHFVNPLQILSQQSEFRSFFAEMGFPDLGEEIAVSYESFSAMAEDFWPVLNKLRSHYGMSGVTHDVSGYHIDD